MSCREEGVPGSASDAASRGPFKFQLKMPSDARLLSIVRSAVTELAAVSGFEEEQCRCITLAVDEALSNVIRHSYKNRCDREIELTFQLQADCVECTFIDHGEPADLSRVCGQPLDEIALSGRGTHLIRQIMDEVCYTRTVEGNRLSLKKYLPAVRRQSLTRSKCKE